MPEDCRHHIVSFLLYTTYLFITEIKEIYSNDYYVQANSPNNNLDMLKAQFFMYCCLHQVDMG